MPPDRRRLDLRAAAAALADGPPEEVTMAGVARALGLAKPTLYRLAHSRAELLSACVEAEAERLVEHLHAAFTEAGPGGQTSCAARADLALERFAADSPGGFALLFDAARPQARPAVRRAEDRLRDLLHRAGEEADPPVAAALLGGAAARARRRREDASRQAASTGRARGARPRTA